MNKTIIININGIVFHIEEDAYELLKGYMTEVKLHFAYTPDSAEIVSDIESRIAEMFSEKLTEESKQVIVIRDVEFVKSQMGSVSDFAAIDDEDSYTDTLRTGKKLFRDGEDQIIGGVCSGIAHYFGIQIRMIRLIALLMLIIGGSGLPIYIIFWLVMPKARTRSEKMAMKGEPINIQNFKRNFDDELESIGRNLSGSTTSSAFFRNLFARIFHVLGSILKIFVKVVGGFIIFAGTMTLLAALVALLVLLGLWDSAELNTFPFNVINPEYQSAIYFSAFVLILIPLIALILFALRILFNRTLITKTAWFVMLVIWLTGLATGVYYGSRMLAQFSEEASFEQTIAISSLPAYRLELNESAQLSKEDSAEYNISTDSMGRTITITDRGRNSEMPRNVSLRIEKSDVAAATLVQEYSAKGLNFKSALKSAQRTVYQFSQTDSILKFDWAAHIPKTDRWRNQEVKLTLKVPVNTRLYIDGRLNWYLQDFNLEDCQPEGSLYETISEWMMTEDGLKCKNDSLYQKRRNEY